MRCLVQPANPSAYNGTLSGSSFGLTLRANNGSRSAMSSYTDPGAKGSRSQFVSSGGLPRGRQRSTWR